MCCGSGLTSWRAFAFATTRCACIASTGAPPPASPPPLNRAPDAHPSTPRLVAYDVPRQSHREHGDQKRNRHFVRRPLGPSRAASTTSGTRSRSPALAPYAVVGLLRVAYAIRSAGGVVARTAGSPRAGHIPTTAATRAGISTTGCRYAARPARAGHSPARTVRHHSSIRNAGVHRATRPATARRPRAVGGACVRRASRSTTVTTGASAGPTAAGRAPGARPSVARKPRFECAKIGRRSGERKPHVLPFVDEIACVLQFQER